MNSAGVYAVPARRALSRHYPWILIGLLWMVAFLNAADRSILVAVMPKLRDEFGLTPERLALIHFGLVEDVARHLAELRGRLDTWSKRVAEGAAETDFVVAARADLPAEEADAYDRAMPFWQSYAGLRRYWDTRE